MRIESSLAQIAARRNDDGGRPYVARNASLNRRMLRNPVARSDPESIGEILDGGFIEKPLLDQPHSSRDGSSRPVPDRAPRCGFGSAAQTWPKARPLGRSRRGKELNILGLRRPYWANRAAVDAGCPHTREKHAVKGRVPRQTRTIAGLPIETEGQSRSHAHRLRARGGR
jgi:hypothetical protein